MDLDDPEFEISVLLAGQDDSSGYWDDTQQNDLILWGLRNGKFAGTYNGTSHTERPFYKPEKIDHR